MPGKKKARAAAPSRSPSRSRKAPKRTVKASKAAVAVDPDEPSWFDSDAPLGSAVRHVAALSPKFNWVGVYELKGKQLVLGPYLGAKTSHTKIKVGQGVCGTAVAEDKDQNVPDVRAVKNYLSCSLETRSELVVLVRDRGGKVVGQIDIDSHWPAAFGVEEESAVRKIADELGERWPV